MVLTNALPAGLNILTTTATLGNVTVTNGMLIWDVGTLTNGLGATLTVTASPTQAGTFANTLCFSGGSGLAIFTTPGEITVLPAQKPSLFIRLLEGEVQLAWPTNAADYRLVRAPSLSPTNVWENVTNAPVSVESEYRLNLSPPSSPATGFYKLIKP